MFNSSITSISTRLASHSGADSERSHEGFTKPMDSKKSFSNKSTFAPNEVICFDVDRDRWYGRIAIGVGFI